MSAEVSLPPVVSRTEWLAARKALLAQEKDATRARDAVNAARRRLPMVKVEQPYSFEGPNGQATLAELFDGRRQLYVHHFMWIDEKNAPCPGCSFAADMNFNCVPLLAYLNSRDVTFVAVARAPYSRIHEVKRSKGWNFPMYSSANTTFNYDFQATLDESRGAMEFNYRSIDEHRKAGVPEEMLRGDGPCNSIFIRDGNEVYHAYSASQRGLDQLFTPYNFLDLTPFGRQEAWEDSPPGWPKNSAMF